MRKLTAGDRTYTAGASKISEVRVRARGNSWRERCIRYEALLAEIEDVINTARDGIYCSEIEVLIP